MEDRVDERRKLSELDYKRIRFMVECQDMTIRETATAYGCSTKYVKRLLNQVRTDVTAMVTCSGCGYGFVDIRTHYETWTSGFVHELSCGLYAP